MRGCDSFDCHRTACRQVLGGELVQLQGGFLYVGIGDDLQAVEADQGAVHVGASTPP